LDIHFTFGTSCERAAPLAEKNAAARHHVLRSLISLRSEHRVLVSYTSPNIKTILGDELIWRNVEQKRPLILFEATNLTYEYGSFKRLNFEEHFIAG
jgi:hypothetical protein